MTGGRFFDEFIDDYFSECDEHLADVRRVLLALEDASSVAPDPATLQELSRALHTLKGLSGMVGLVPAEAIAHAMEDCLRAVDRSEAVSPVMLKLLFDGEALLEACVEGRRSGAGTASPAPYLDRVRDVIGARLAANPETPVSADVAPSSPTPTSAIAVRQPDGVLRRFDFVPSTELVKRGIGVEVIRRRLADLGEIAATMPRVRPGGGVSFEFSVAIPEEMPPPPESWRSDGLSWEDWSFEPAPNRHGVVVHTSRPTSPVVVHAASNVVRVDLAKLDDLMRMVGELVVTRSRLGEAVSRANTGVSAATIDELNEASDAIDRQLRTMREGVMRIRLVPVGEVFERMRFAMRDVARESDKGIHIEFSGQDTEIDKLLVDRLLEPLLHLVRNAASHGIESADERRVSGKPAEGTIALRAQAAGDRIVLEIEDDGAGIDVRRVGERAQEMGLVSSGDALEPDALLEVICSPGFSMRETADRSSGRGVGMAVVRSTIRELGGELFVASVLGRGTRFTIELPLTLMITDALIFEVGDQTMAIPQINLREILPLDQSAVTRFENNEVLTYRGRVIPLVSLAKLFKLDVRPNAPRHVLVVGTDLHLAGLVADRVLGFREIVVHPVADPLVAVPGVAGATELADGRVSLILDAAALVRGTRDRGQHGPMRSLYRSAQDATLTLSSPEHVWS